MTCPLCNPSKHIIARDAHWTMVLNNDQGYLGRCYFALNRHETDLTVLSSVETNALWSFFGAAKLALDKLWSPDHYNYVFLMNVQPHLHGHIIPRYAGSRTFGGLTFVDGRLGQHYDLTNTVVPEDTVLARIAEEIKRAMSPNKDIDV